MFHISTFTSISRPYQLVIYSLKDVNLSKGNTCPIQRQLKYFYSDKIEASIFLTSSVKSDLFSYSYNTTINKRDSIF